MSHEPQDFHDESEEFRLETEPKGSLVPPGRRPPTAVGADMLPSPAPERHPTGRRVYPPLRRRSGLAGVFDNVLDVLDSLGDSIADATGVRKLLS